MSNKTFTMDARLPVSADTPKDDPNHPKNVCKGMIVMQNQASADTKYDIQPPPRVEGFEVPQNFDPKFCIACIFVAIALTVVVWNKNFYVKIVCVIVLFLCIKYATYKLEKRTV